MGLRRLPEPFFRTHGSPGKARVGTFSQLLDCGFVAPYIGWCDDCVSVMQMTDSVIGWCDDCVSVMQMTDYCNDDCISLTTQLMTVNQ